MTEYHNYNTPAQGESDWHEPLNENFEQIDNDVEIRATESELDQYTPTDGAKFLATDTGRIYVGDGDQWRDIQLTPTEKYLEEGFIVGVANGYRTVEDPREHSDDAAALQAANDDLVETLSEHNATGYVYIPSLTPSGSALSIGETVTFGSESARTTIFPRGWGFVGSQSPMINCTIDDGSPMFLVASGSDDGNMATGNVTEFGGFLADAGGRDAELLRLKNVTSFYLTRTHARHFDNESADGVYVFDGACYNSYINRTSFVATDHNCSGADIWVLRDDTGDGPPGELKFGPGNTTYADPSLGGFNTGLRCEVNSSSIVWGGRIEGASGDAVIYFTDGYLTVTDYTEIGAVLGRGTDSIRFDGYMLRVSPGFELGANESGGHGIHIESMARGHIPPLPNDGVDGNIVQIDEDGGHNNYIVVPYEETFNGSVSYPSPGWGQLVYPDGWQKHAVGTTTIAADSTTTLSNHAGTAGTEIRLTNLSIASDPDGDPRFQTVRGWRDISGEDGKQWIGIKETAGVSFELSWEIHRRPS